MKLGSATWFTLVGAAASVVHYLSAVFMEGVLDLNPGSANLLAFLLAFPVSYIGHQTFSFAGNGSQHKQALPRYLLLACSGFAANQIMVLSLLNYTILPFWLALGLVMGIVAVSTYLLSRHWAFKHKN